MSHGCMLCAGARRRRLFTKQGRDLVRCRDCGLVWVDPMPAPAALASYYEGSYREGRYASYTEAQQIRRLIAEHRLERIRPWARGTRWLDVGCASGEFAASARRSQIAAEGLDVSETAVAAARALGVEAHHCAVEAFRPERPYGTVTAFDVIEHLVDPRAFLSRLHAWLEPGGTLAMTLPNVRSIYPRLLMGRHWFYYWPDEHLFYFDPDTISKLLEQEGFTVERVTRAYKPLTLTYAAGVLTAFNARFGRLFGAGVSALPRPLGSRVWNLYIGEMMVLARRRRERTSA